MAFKRSGVRSSLAPPNQYDPNRYPIGDEFGFFVSIKRRGSELIDIVIIDIVTYTGLYS